MNLGEAFRVRYSPCGEWLVSTGTRSVKIWRVDREELACEFPLAHPSHIAFSRDSARLAVKTTSGAIWLVDRSDSGWEKHGVRCLSEGGCEGPAPQFVRDGLGLMDGSWDGDLTLRNVSGGVAWSQEFGGQGIRSVMPGCDGTVLVCQSAKQGGGDPLPAYLTEWSIGDDVRLIRRVCTGICHAREVCRSPDGEVVAMAISVGRPRVVTLDVASGRVIADSVVSRQHGAALNLRWSADGQLAAVFKDAVVGFDRQLRQLWQAAWVGAWDVDFSPDGKWMAVASSSGCTVAHPA